MTWRSTGSHCKLQFFLSIFEEESDNGLFGSPHVLNSLGKPRMQMDQKTGSGREKEERTEDLYYDGISTQQEQGQFKITDRRMKKKIYL